MAKKTVSKKTSTKAVSAASKITKAATVAAGSAIRKASKTTKSTPSKPTVTSRMKAAVKKPLANVTKAKQTLVSKVATAAHDAGMAAATAVGAAMGAVDAVKDVVGAGETGKGKSKAKKAK